MTSNRLSLPHVAKTRKQGKLKIVYITSSVEMTSVSIKSFPELAQTSNEYLLFHLNKIRDWVQAGPTSNVVTRFSFTATSLSGPHQFMLHKRFLEI